MAEPTPHYNCKLYRGLEGLRANLDGYSNRGRALEIRSRIPERNL
jgi:hypothetical protein